MKFRLVVEFDTKTRRWSAVFPELPGCASAGDTEEEAVTNAKEALALWFEPAPVKLPKRAKLLEVALPRASVTQSAPLKTWCESFGITVLYWLPSAAAIRNGVIRMAAK